MAISFIDGGNHLTVRLELTTLVVIGTARLVVNPTTIRSWTWRPQDVFDTTQTNIIHHNTELRM